MSNYNLGALALQEIKEAMRGLRGALAKAEAARLAARFDCHPSTIYSLSADERPERKVRSDKGKRALDLEHDGLRLVAELVVLNNFDVDLAIETANVNGCEIPAALGTVQRYLREHGLNKRANTKQNNPHRRFEAKAPGEIFQFDMSGVKERWVDIKTRRILHVPATEVSKNHPNKKTSRVPLWKFVVKDDFSRVTYMRFIACNRPTSSHVADFLLEAFRELCIPKMLYTDNDGTITGKRMRRAERILNDAFKESGGFKIETHLPGQAQASGKVERSHQVVEKFEKLFSLDEEHRTLEELDNFARNICTRVNWREHRATGVAPMIRWQSQRQVVRVPPPALLNSAFKCDEFTRVLSAALTISIDGQVYQLPRKRPFSDYANQKISIVWPADEADWFVAILPNDDEYQVERKLAGTDAAGEYKAAEESTRQQNIKRLEVSAHARAEERKADKTRIIKPLMDRVEEAPQSVALFPQPREEMNAATLAELSHVPSVSAGRFITYWEALFLFIEEGSLTNSAADKAYLKVIFAGRDEMLDTDLRAEIATHTPQVSTITEIQRRA